MRATLATLLLLAGCQPQQSTAPASRRADPLWQTTAGIAAVRDGHTATLLPNGRVLLAGGAAGPAKLNTALIYDPATGLWAGAGQMSSARSHHIAQLVTSMTGPEVLVAGGSGAAEAFDIAAQLWLPAGGKTFGDLESSALLLDGGVLVMGVVPLINSSLYNPSNLQWINKAPMTTRRVGFTSTVLPNGRVLVAGGQDQTLTLSSAELYDPGANTWASGGAMAIARTNHAATLLPDGTVLISGGNDDAGQPLRSTELYFPATNSWDSGTPMAVSRSRHTTTLLPSGHVLAVGSIAVAPAELYYPASQAWVDAGTEAQRTGHSATLLQDGRVLIVGGIGKSTADLFEEVPVSCGSGSECPLGLCVDGFCCDAPCNGACDACNLPGTQGVCKVRIAAEPGVPSCGPLLCDGTSRICPATCTSDASCASTHTCEAGVCTLKAAQGTACTVGRLCLSGSCSDGVCCERACNGPCDTCAADGTCSILAEGAEGSPSCGTYVCSGTTAKCFGTCTSDAQCAAPNFCSGGFCTTTPRTEPPPPPVARPCGCGAAGSAPLLAALALLYRRFRARRFHSGKL